MQSSQSKRVLAAAVIVIVILINIFSVLAVIPGANIPPLDAPAADEVDSPVQAELVDTAGLTTPGGLGVFLSSLFLAVISYGLFRNRPWEAMAMLFLGADIFFKVLNIISHFATLGFNHPNILLSIVMIVVESALIVMLFFNWQRTQPDKRMTSQT